MCNRPLSPHTFRRLFLLCFSRNEQLIGAKVTSATPGSIGDQTRKEAEFIKYTPNPNAPGYNKDAKQRVVRMVAAQVRKGCAYGNQWWQSSVVAAAMVFA